MDFSGPPERLRGRAVIDGADYEWTGEMGRGSPGWFTGKFTGNRYHGSFRLKEKGSWRTGVRMPLHSFSPGTSKKPLRLGLLVLLASGSRGGRGPD